MFTNITPALVAQVFPVTPLANIKANLPTVLAALAAQQCDRNLLIMALATIRAETESFLPLEEFQSKYNTAPDGPPFALYDFRTDLGNQGPPDGSLFRGRGYVQLTGRANYAHFGPIVNLDLIANPSLAAVNANAAALLTTFLMQKKAQIENALLTHDLAAARRLVNGGTNGLNRFTDAFHRADSLFPQIP
jgi:putative chitinase